MNLREKLSAVLSVESSDDVRYQITKYILESINNNKYPTIMEVSQNCYIAKSSIVRYAKKFGLEGYKEFINRLKFEDQYNYGIREDKILDIQENKNYKKDDFYIFSNSLIDFIKQSDKYLPTLMKMSDLILDSEKIYIHSSYEFDKMAGYLKDFLLLINKNVFYSSFKKTNSLVLEFITEKDLQFFLVAGVDNGYLKTIFEYSSSTKESKKILISSESQSQKFNNCDIELILNFKNDCSLVYEKEIKMLYILKQLFIILEKECGFEGFRNLKHKF